MISNKSLIEALQQFESDVPVMLRKEQKLYEIVGIEAADFSAEDIPATLGQMPILVIVRTNDVEAVEE